MMPPYVRAAQRRLVVPHTSVRARTRPRAARSRGARGTRALDVLEALPGPPRGGAALAGDRLVRVRRADGSFVRGGKQRARRHEDSREKHAHTLTRALTRRRERARLRAP